MTKNELKDFLRRNDFMLIKSHVGINRDKDSEDNVISLSFKIEVVTDYELNRIFDKEEKPVEFDIEFKVRGSETDHTIMVHKSGFNEAWRCSCAVGQSNGVCHHIECARLYYLNSGFFPKIMSPDKLSLYSVYDVFYKYGNVIVSGVTADNFYHMILEGFSIAQIKKHFNLSYIPGGKLFYAVIDSIRMRGELKHETIRRRT